MCEAILHVFMAWYLVKHKDNFAFTFTPSHYTYSAKETHGHVEYMSVK